MPENGKLNQMHYHHGLLKRWRSLLPTLLAFSLLFAQAAIPWTVSSFATEDGPSHVYNAVVASDLVLHRELCRTGPPQSCWR